MGVEETFIQFVCTFSRSCFMQLIRKQSTLPTAQLHGVDIIIDCNRSRFGDELHRIALHCKVVFLLESETENSKTKENQNMKALALINKYISISYIV